MTSSFIACNTSYEAAEIAIFGAPYDSTTSFRPGARFAGSAMRAESFGIETYSPRQDRDLEECHVHDLGDLELPFGDPVKPLEMIYRQTRQIVADGKMPVLIGGEHLVSLGAIRAVAEKYGNLHIIHFDAHADLREDYLGVKLSHACIMRRCHDLLGDGKIFQFGIRSGSREEFQFMKDGHVTTCPFTIDGVSSLKLDRAIPVYLSIDLDVLDPSEFPGTGTPEAGGVSYRALLDAVLDIFTRFNIVAFDNVELAPMLDTSGRSTALACKLLREELIAAQKSISKGE